MSANKAKSKEKPSIYIDTCILRDVKDRRNQGSIDFMSWIKIKGLTCFISFFGLMELTGIEKEDIFIRRKLVYEKATLDEVISERKNLDLKRDEFVKCSQYIEQVADTYSFLEVVDLDNNGWNLALTIAVFSNLHATDAVHLAAAWQADCAVIITRDTFFIKEAAKYLKAEKLDSGDSVWSVLRICEPKECYSVLENMGFEGVIR